MAMQLTSATALPPLARLSAPEDTLDLTDDPVLLQLQPDALEIAENGAEEMAQLRTLFANRRDFEKKRGSLEENYDQVLETDAPEKIEKIVALLDAGEVSIESLLQYAGSLFPDPSDLVLVLTELLRQKKNQKVEQATLQAALEEAIQRAAPKTLKSGVNVALKARLFAARMSASPAQLRQCYRQFLENLELAVSLYQGWVNDFGADRRAQVVDFIESALFADMHAHDPSCTRPEFGGLLAALRQLRMLRSSDDRFVLSLKTAWQMDEQMSLLLLLALLQNPYEVRELIGQMLGDGLRMAAPRDRSVLIQCLLSGFRWIPEELFVLADAREHLLTELAEMADQFYRHELRHPTRRSVAD